MPRPSAAVSQCDHLVGHVASEGFIKIGEAADHRAINQLAIDLALIAALIAAHQQDFLLSRYLGKALANRVAFDQYIVIVFEEEHAEREFMSNSRRVQIEPIEKSGENIYSQI